MLHRTPSLLLGLGATSTELPEKQRTGPLTVKVASYSVHMHIGMTSTRRGCTMPRGDGTGPTGQGPLTGRGLGSCIGTGIRRLFQRPAAGVTQPNAMSYGRIAGRGARSANGRRAGRGQGQGRGRGRR